MLPKVNWSWMDIRSIKGVGITGPSTRFIGHSYTPQRSCSDSYWLFGLVMNNLLLDQSNFYWTLSDIPREWLKHNLSFDLRLIYSLTLHANILTIKPQREFLSVWKFKDQNREFNKVKKVHTLFENSYLRKHL